jgi:PIN like domain
LKKLSATNLKQLDDIVFFVDRSLGKNVIATALAAIGAKVEIHDDHFAQDTDDIEWLTEVGRRKWIVLSKDERIRHHPLELHALKTAKVGAFFLTSKGISGSEMAEIFVRAFPNILNACGSNKPPFVFLVYKDGKIAKVKIRDKGGWASFSLDKKK